MLKIYINEEVYVVKSGMYSVNFCWLLYTKYCVYRKNK